MHEVVAWARSATRNRPVLKAALLPCLSVARWASRWRHHVIKEINGVRYELDLGQSIDASIYFTGRYERDVVSVLKTIVQPGFTALDVGANIGCHTFLLATLAGPTGHVTAFEPTGWAFRKLQRNAALNPHLQNITLKKLALSDRIAMRSPVRFKSSWPVTGGTEPPPEELTDFSTVDEYVHQNNIERIDLIKLDVDGYEFRVLTGAQQTLRDRQPYLVMELEPKALSRNNATAAGLVGLILRHGYEIRLAEDLRHFSNPTELIDLATRAISTNVVCFPPRSRSHLLSGTGQLPLKIVGSRF